MTEHLSIRTSYCRYNVGFVWLGIHACCALRDTGLVWPVYASDLPLPSEGLSNTDKQRAHDESNGNFQTSRTSYASLMFPHITRKHHHITQAMSTLVRRFARYSSTKMLEFTLYHSQASVSKRLLLFIQTFIWEQSVKGTLLHLQ